jgi:hypothetical protein
MAHSSSAGLERYRRWRVHGLLGTPTARRWGVASRPPALVSTRVRAVSRRRDLSLPFSPSGCSWRDRGRLAGRVTAPRTPRTVPDETGSAPIWGPTAPAGGRRTPDEANPRACGDGVPGPEEREAGALPPDHRGGLDDGEGIRPVGPQAGQQDREQAVGGSQRWTRHGALEDDQLVPQREVLEHEGAQGPDTTQEACEDQADHAGHHRSGQPTVQC